MTPPAPRKCLTLTSLVCAMIYTVISVWFLLTRTDPSADDVRDCSPLGHYDRRVQQLQLDEDLNALQRLVDTNHYLTIDDQCIPCSTYVPYNTTTMEELLYDRNRDICGLMETSYKLDSFLLSLREYAVRDPCTIGVYLTRVWYTKYIIVLCAYAALVCSCFPCAIAAIHSLATWHSVEPTNALTMQELRNGAELVRQAVSATQTAWSDWSTTRRDRHAARRLHALQHTTAIGLPPELLQITNSLLDDQPTLREAFT